MPTYIYSVNLTDVFFKGMLKNFDNDTPHISIVYLPRLRVLGHRGITVTQLLRIEHMGNRVSHILAVLLDGRYACDCCMGTKSMSLLSSLDLINVIRFSRWFQDAKLDVIQVSAVVHGFHLKPHPLTQDSAPPLNLFKSTIRQ
jgi:hypothetical protein